MSDAPLKLPKVAHDGKLVLIAERDPFYRGYLEHFFRQARIEPEFVLDGVAALKRIKARQPHLFIAEATLPLIDGLSLCRHIRADQSVAKIPVVIFTVLEVKEQALEAGADAFIAKPFDSKSFAQTVSQFVPLEIKEQAE